MAKIVLDPEAFKVLASDTRLAILKSLDERPKTVSELAREQKLNKATVFEHLQQLVKGDLVKKKDSEGRKWVYYTLSWKGRSLLHPEQATFMVLFGLAALGGVGAFFQMGQWLKWWALGSLFGGGGEDATADGADASPLSMPAERSGNETEEAPADAQQDAMAAQEPPENSFQDDGAGFFDFISDPQFWLFAVLLLATVALIAAAIAVHRRGRARDALLHPASTTDESALEADAAEDASERGED